MMQISLMINNWQWTDQSIEMAFTNEEEVASRMDRDAPSSINQLSHNDDDHDDDWWWWGLDCVMTSTTTRNGVVLLHYTIHD